MTRLWATGGVGRRLPYAELRIEADHVVVDAWIPDFDLAEELRTGRVHVMPALLALGNWICNLPVPVDVNQVSAVSMTGGMVTVSMRRAA